MMAQAVEVAAGIARLACRTPTLPPATHTNSYALGSGQVLLVEPAASEPSEQAEWLNWARGMASQGRSLQAIVITHHHVDHVAGAVLFARELQLPLYLHEETRRRLPGLPSTILQNDGDELLLDGPEPQRWRVLHTPGHAPGHICLHEPERRMLVVGDMVASQGTILISPEDGDLAQYLVQLARLSALEATLALPAHGEAITAPSATFQHYIRHRLAREDSVMRALSSGERMTTDALVPIVYADVPKGLWSVAKLSLRSHLMKLAAEGTIEREGTYWWLTAPRAQL